jgi:outer membrane receptor protein involved in Fe transport
MVYVTASRGFRPGGINRRGTLPPYRADFINNYEFGFKTSWLDNRLRFNGAIYQLDWNDVQLSFLGANGLTEIRNAADARIRGFELDLLARPVSGLTLSAGLAHNDAKTTSDFCRFPNRAFDCTVPEPDSTTDEDLLPEDNFVVAPAGTRLPITAKWKGNALARFEFPVGAMEAHLQGGLVYEGGRTSDLRPVENSIFGNLPSYTSVDLSAGLKGERWTAELFVRNLFDENGQVVRSIQCVETVCGDPDGGTAIGGKVYTYVIQPRTIGIKVGTKF